ncbi:MAG: trigger factor [Acidimicrobiia bacterium]|nr:trigger factor [Acidimicrobiia bacterium]
MIEVTLRLFAVESTLAQADGGKVRISIHLDRQEMEAAEEAAYRRIVRQVRLPGFRPGRAPRKVLEARLGAGYIRAEAMQDALGDYYQQAVVRHDVDVIAPPEIDITAGRDEGAVSFEALVEVRPEVTADGYDALTVEIPSPLPTDEEINTRIDALRAQFSELETVSRPAIDTDHVTIDVVGSQNGVEVEGLTVSDYTYEVGSGAVVPEIDENLRGAKVGDILEFNARHPDESIEDLLRFRILVKEVQARILPELDDDLVSAASEFDTVVEFRDDVTERLTELKAAQVRMLFRERISEAVAHLVVADLPEALIVTETDRRLGDLQQVLENQNGTLEEYLAATGQTAEELRDQLREPAEQSVRLDLALRAVADAEGLEVDDADLQAEAERTAERLELDPAEVRDRLGRSGGWSTLRAERRKAMALDWLMENAAVTDPDGIAIAPELLAPPQADAAAGETESDDVVDGFDESGESDESDEEAG